MVPNSNRIKQAHPQFQCIAQEQLANHSWSTGYCYVPDDHQSNYVPAISQAPAQKRDNTHNYNASLDDVFMPKYDAANASDGEMDAIDHELEEFKRFCLMTKPLENRIKVTVKVNLKDLCND